jgi:hypothetical protein
MSAWPYAKLDDPPYPVDVKVYAKSKWKKAINKATGEVKFKYQYATGAIEWLMRLLRSYLFVLIWLWTGLWFCRLKLKSR